MAKKSGGISGDEFLAWLFGDRYQGQVLVRRIANSGGIKKFLLVPGESLPDMDGRANWYFGACTRMPNDNTHKSLLNAPALWVDLDGVDEVPDLVELAAPSAVVRTGHGYHAYWKLGERQDPAVIKDVLRYAALVLSGDLQSAEPARLLRIPGTKNVKSDPVVDCEVAWMDGPEYDLEGVKRAMMAAALGSCYEEGLRNEVVLGFSAAMARSGVHQTAVMEMVEAVCSHFGDREVKSRLLAVQSTYEKHDAGDLISPRGFADMAGEVYSATMRLLGKVGGESEVMLGEESVGTVATIQQDLANLFVGPKCRWAWSEGQPMVWGGDCWRPVEPKTLTWQVFQVMDKLTYTKGEEKKRLPAKYGVAEGVAKLVTGKLAEKPMGDGDADLLGFLNGTLRLSTGEFRPAAKEDCIRKLLPVEYDADAPAGAWEKFLSSSVPESASFLQEWLGYCLRPGNPYERMLWVYGPSNTGKSTFLVTVFNLFGPLAAALSSQNVSQYQIASLADSRVAMCTELNTSKFRTSVFKGLVSGDPIMARHPYGRPFPVEFKGKFMWASNSLPTLDELEGVAKRIVLVPFERRPKKDDKGLKAKLLAELPGIVNWAVEGLRRVDGIAASGKFWEVPESSRRLGRLYDGYQDTVRMFMEEEIETGPGYGAPLLDVFQRYSMFLRDLGAERAEFGTWFVEELRRRGLEVEDRRVVGARFRKGGAELGWGIENGGRREKK